MAQSWISPLFSAKSDETPSVVQLIAENLTRVPRPRFLRAGIFLLPLLQVTDPQAGPGFLFSSRRNLMRGHLLLQFIAEKLTRVPRPRFLRAGIFLLLFVLSNVPDSDLQTFRGGKPCFRTVVHFCPPGQFPSLLAPIKMNRERQTPAQIHAVPSLFAFPQYLVFPPPVRECSRFTQRLGSNQICSPFVFILLRIAFPATPLF